MSSFLFRLYDKAVLSNPRICLGVIVLLGVIFGLQAGNFKLDASSDSLVLENDEDLRYYRDISKIYSGDDFLIITYTPFEWTTPGSRPHGPRGGR